MFKICSKCLLEKERSLFAMDRQSKDGLQARCRQCQSEYRKENKERIALYNRKNRHKYAGHAPSLTKEAMKEYHKQWYLKNREKILNKVSIWAKENKEKYRKNQREYVNKRSANDICFMLTRRLRTRLYCAIRDSAKTGSAIEDLGCSIDFLKQYLEKLFQPGMSWDNHGEWHIDHIIPLSKFDLSDRNELIKACHYSNLQPLWAIDNIRKGNKVG